MDQNIDFSSVNDRDILFLVKTSREGLHYSTFNQMKKNIPLKTDEWSRILHLSERTLQRYKKEKISFNPLYSERIMEIQLLFNKGAEVFNSKEKFYIWLKTRNVALGGIEPVTLLDNTFGIRLLEDELIRIEHGVLS